VTIEREKPVSQALVIGVDGTGGDIQLDEWHKVLAVSGPGSFISAVVSKKGGIGRSPIDTINTTVRLWLDQKEIIIKSFEVARAMGLTQQNYSGVVWLRGEEELETLVLGFEQPLFFTRVLELSILVADPQVEKALLQVTYTKKATGEDEGTGGGDRAPPYP
jgi:hypothetical protein